VAYSEELAERIRELLGARAGVTERKMFGGVGWMINGNMACGTMGDDVIVRLDADAAGRALDEPHVRPMDFSGRTMRAFVAVDAAGVASAPELARWVDAGASYAASLPPK
jgi:TfoX/Sxy family transcriptional regulator of competence genes